MSTSVWPLLIGFLSFLYLLSFVLLAIVRIGTGLSIQRLGYFSLKRVAYAVSDGVRIEIRDVRFHVHRPSYARPTWITLRFRDLKVVVDPVSDTQGGTARFASGSQTHRQSESRAPNVLRSGRRSDPTTGRWKRLFEVKETLKRLHTKIEWLRFVDVDILNAAYCIIGTCSVQVSSCTIAVDTRYEIVERGRLFRHKDITKQEQQPAEWTILLKNVFLKLDRKSSVEVVDTCAINIHGLLYKDIIGLRDTSVSLKLGRVYIPFKDIIDCRDLYRHGRPKSQQDTDNGPMQPQEDGGGNNDGPAANFKAPYSERRIYWERLLSSVIAGIQEIQLAASFVGASLHTGPDEVSSRPCQWHFAMNEFGIDLFRLEPNSPAHRTYFPQGEMAHQVLLAAISIAISLDGGQRKPERFIYIPMATATVKTTLASQVLTQLCHDEVEQASTLFANLSLTSPSLDLELRNLPLVLGRLHTWTTAHKHSPPGAKLQIHPRKSPRVSFKASIQEPVARMVLPLSSATPPKSFEYDLLIMSISSVSLELEAHQVAPAASQDTLSLTTRISSYHLYYQNCTNQKLTILNSDLLEVKTRVFEDPELSFFVACNLETFSLHLVRSEIIDGITKVLGQLRHADSSSLETYSHEPPGPFLLRQLPSSLTHVRFEAAGFCIELAGHDPLIPDHPCGIAVQIENWTSTWTPHEQSSREFYRNPPRASSSRIVPEDFNAERLADSVARTSSAVSESRKLACHWGVVEFFLIQDFESCDSGPFISIPKIDVAIALRPDTLGGTCDVKANVRAFVVRYSLLATYASFLALKTGRLFFMYLNDQPTERLTSSSFKSHVHGSQGKPHRRQLGERMSLSAKVTFLQVQVKMPHDPPLLLRVSGLDCRASPGAPVSLKGRSVQLCSKALVSTNAWSSILFSRHFQVKLNDYVSDESSQHPRVYSVDVSSDLTRFAVPHQLVFCQVVDNLTCLLKATEQLHNRFYGRPTTEAKSFRRELRLMPRTSFRSKTFILELEDGLFDWKLGLIYRVGLSEQRQRLAREEAFHIKVKKVHPQDHQRDSSRYRQRNPTQQHHVGATQSHLSSDYAVSRNERLDDTQCRTFPNAQPRQMRYDAEGMGSLTESASITSGEAWSKLHRHNAINWQKRIRSAHRRQILMTMNDRNQFGGSDEDRDWLAEPSRVLEVPGYPALYRVEIRDFCFALDKPSFSVGRYRTFLAEIGKGNPHDMAYSLLVPTNVQINMGETRISLRNYPLPLLHIPATNSTQSRQSPCWSLKTDFVIAEEYHGEDSMRTVEIDIVPEHSRASSGSSDRPVVSIRRSISPVKTYSNVDVIINTCDLTGITWGTAYQPAIQDMMQVIEKFTKPRIDSSRSIGFWDKIRLVVHSRLRVAWTGGGDVHLRLKGMQPLPHP